MRGICLWVCACLFVPALHAAPFVPADPDEVVERLPSRRLAQADRQLQRQMRERLVAEPASLPVALEAARAALRRARQSGDPRELGQAQAALAPWWAQPDPPPAVRLLRATVLQAQHQFDGALRDLNALAAARSAPVAFRAQAVLTRSAVLQVLGRWPHAQASCAQLQAPEFIALGTGVSVPARVCEAEIGSLRGNAAAAAVSLKATAHALADPATSRWVALVRAELAERLGDDAAGALYQRALGETPETYTLAAYSDWLLSRGRPADVVKLLQGRDEADALLLRLAIAWRQTNDPRATQAARTLQERFAAAALRHDNAHRREQARFELDVQGNATAALPIALANWAEQKEPADTLLLVRAAAAARQPAAVEPLWRFMRETGYTDARLVAARSEGTR